MSEKTILTRKNQHESRHSRDTMPTPLEFERIVIIWRAHIFYLTFCSHDIILANNSNFELPSRQQVHLSRIEVPPYSKWNGKLF